MEIILDGALMTDRTAVHDLLAEKFGFPDYYGRNLDALYDLLSAYSVPVAVTIVHEAQMHDNLGSYGKSLLRTLHDGSSSNPNVKLSVFNENI